MQLKERGPHDEDGVVLSERSSVRIGLVLTVLTLCAGGVIAVVAFGSSKVSEFSTKLDSISAMIASFNTQQAILERRVSDHEASDTKEWKSMDTRMTIQEQVGSAPLRLLREDYQRLRQEFEVERALAAQRIGNAANSKPATTP